MGRAEDVLYIYKNISYQSLLLPAMDNSKERRISPEDFGKRIQVRLEEELSICSTLLLHQLLCQERRKDIIALLC